MDKIKTTFVCVVHAAHRRCRILHGFGRRSIDKLRIDDDKRYYKQYDRKVNRHDDFALSAELFGRLAFCLYAGLGFAQSHRLENFDFRSCGVAVFDSAAADVIRVKTIP